METRPTLENARAFIQQITRSSLRDLMFAVRRNQALPRGSGIEQLDRTILEEQERVKTYKETIGETLETSEQTNDPMIKRREDGKYGGFKNGDILEIQGPSGCGKTEIVYQLTMSRILPFSHTFLRTTSALSSGAAEPIQIEFGGASLSAVIYSLTSAPYSITRLSSILHSHIQSTLIRTHSLSDIDITLRDQIDDLVRTCLRRVRLCRIDESRGMWGLAIALRSFKTLVDNEMEEAEEVGLVVVDGFGESFWADRAAWEEEMKERQSKKRKAVSSLENRDHDIRQDDEDLIAKEKLKEKDDSTAEEQNTSLVEQESAWRKQPMYQALLQLTSIRQRYSSLIVLTTQLLTLSTGPKLKPTPNHLSTQVLSPSSMMPVFTPTHLPYPYYQPFPPFRRAPPKEIRDITYHLSIESAEFDRADAINTESTEMSTRTKGKIFNGLVRGKGWVGLGRGGRELCFSIGVE